MESRDAAASPVGQVMGGLLQQERSRVETPSGGMTPGEQARIRRELEMCRRIQLQLLPGPVSVLPFAELRAISRPAGAVGGDFFNYFTLPGGDLAVLIGDVSGKGVPAALMMANLQATLRARLPQERDLGLLARSLDLEVASTTHGETYATLFLGILNPGSRTLRYLNAGHNGQYVVRESGRLERLDSSGRPVGLWPGGGYVERRVLLAPCDSLFLYTDGLVECENGRGEPFGRDRTERLLVELGAAAPGHVLARIERECERHRGAAAVTDDLTMLLLRVGSRDG